MGPVGPINLTEGENVGTIMRKCYKLVKIVSA